jgi:putative acyl-CoA dehydrogenase
MQREPESVTAYFAEVETARAADARLDRAIDELKRDLKNSNGVESQGRRIVERMAITLQAALLMRHGDPSVAELFLNSRLGGDWGHTFGTLQPSSQFKSVIERHRPRL